MEVHEHSSNRGMRRARAALSALIAVLACLAVLQAQTNTGSIRGTVFDQSEAVIPGTTVKAIDESRGTERATETTERGEYAIDFLEPGLYTLVFESDGFAQMRVEEFEVLVGRVEEFSPELAISATPEQIVVAATDARPIIATRRTQQADHIDFQGIEELPINRRDYLDLALLTPGVVDTNYVAEDTDFRIAPTPQSGLGVGGTNGRGNTFMIDGLDNVYNSGSVRSSISQEAVREFVVNRNTFSTEQGGAPGAAVNIVTRSGTNDLHGSVFGLFRNRRLQARNTFDPSNSPYTRSQAGVRLGGPIRRDKSFFYTAYERLDRHESRFVPLLDDRSFLNNLTPSQQALADVLSQAAPPPFQPLVAQITGALTPGNYPDLVRLFEENSGVFPFGEARDQTLFRFDHTLKQGHSMFLRMNHTKQDSENTNFGSLIARSRGRNSSVNDFGFAFGDTYVLGSKWISETRAGFFYHDFGVYPTDEIGPAIEIAGFGTFGRDFILPTRVLERAYQVRQNFIRTTANNTLKFGGDFNPVRDWARSETFLGGRFLYGEAVPLSAVLDQAGAGLGLPSLSGLVKNLLTVGGQPELASAVDAPISALQSYALGLPIVYQQGFGNPYWTGWANRLNFFVEDTLRIKDQFTLTLGLRYEQEAKTRFPRDNNNFGPRIGFAWSPDSKTVVRGGYGIFFARIDGQITFVSDLLGDKAQIVQAFIPLTGAPGVNSPISGGPLTSAEIFASVRDRGILGNRPITLEDIVPHGINPSPNSPLRVTFRVQDDVVNPYAQQASFELQRQVGQIALSAGYNFNRGIHIIRPLDLNVYKAGEDPVTGMGIPGFHNPAILQDNVYGSWGRSYYHAMILQATRRFPRGVSFTTHYTWSKSIDEATDYNSSFEPHIPWDARNELALSHFHRGHRFVVRTVMESPWKAGKGRGFVDNAFGDFTLSGIVVARSFAPFNLNAGFDNIGDRHTDTHRPLGLGRNVGRGPAFFGADIRLARSFALTEKLEMKVMGEVFNLLNKTNYRTVNGNVGDLKLEDVPDKPSGRVGPVTEPFSFTSAFDPRQLQLSVRLTF